MANEAVVKIREFSKQDKPNRYEIEGHILSDKSDYEKNLYFKMLCMVISYSEQVSEEQSILLGRIINGCGGEHNMNEYMRQGLTVEIGDYKEFVEKVALGDVKYAFVFDMLLLVNMENATEDMQGLMAELVESLEVTEDELRDLVQMCVIVLEQDVEKYVESVMDSNAYTNLEFIKIYLADDGKIKRFEKDGTLILASIKRQRVDFSQYCTRTDGKRYFFEQYNRILIFNLEIDCKHIGVRFEAESDVILKKCNIEGRGYSVVFCCQNVNVYECSFENFTSKTMYLDKVVKVNVYRSRFEQCVQHYTSVDIDWIELGGLIYTNGAETTRLQLEGCTMIACGGKNSYYGYKSSVISNASSVIRNCIFENCWHYCFSEKIDPDDFGRVLFSHIIEEDNNQIINSANLGPC